MAKRKTAAPKANPGRRKYTEGAGGHCSVDKGGGARAVAPLVIPQKFTHKDTGKSEMIASSEHSKPGNAKQVICRKFMDYIYDLGLREIRREFINKLKKYQPKDGSTEAFNEEGNFDKNRYEDVVLWDKTRVKVTINPDKDDYIHASFVNIRDGLSYICAQGPLENTVPQFWFMCLEQEVKVILQLCNNKEGGKEKCSDYMPAGSEKTATYGPIEVVVTDKKKDAQGMRKVNRTKLTIKFGGKEHKLVHLLYYGWPDHSVPDSVAVCREVRKFVHSTYDKKPIVVHCSAGIGRTGSFVAVDMVLSKLLEESNGDFTLPDILKWLRDQRAQAIQNDLQMCFVVRFVLDILITDDLVSKNQRALGLIQEFDDLVERKRKAGKKDE